MHKKYKSLVFTDHALDRLQSRRITQEMVYQVVTNPRAQYPSDQSTKFVKTIQARQIHVIASYLKKEKQWLIISVWVRGEEDQQSIIWRVISFPVWLIWQGVKRVGKRFFHS